MTQNQEFAALQKRIEAESPKEIKIKELENRKMELAQYLKNAISCIKTEILQKEQKISDCTECLLFISSKSGKEVELKKLETQLDNTRTQIKETLEKISKISGQEELASKIKLIDGRCPVCDSKVDHLNRLFEQEHIRKELDILKKKIDALSTQEVSVQEKKQTLETIIKQAIKAEQTLTLHGVKNERDLTPLREEISDLRRNVEKIPRE